MMNVHEFSPMASSFDLLHAVSRSFQSTCVYFCLSYPEKGVILEIPALPVTKGSNLTLRCRLSTGETVAAYFFYSGRLLGPRNKEHTISNVQQSNEGFYWCATDLSGSSAHSYLRVRGQNTDIFCCHHKLGLFCVFLMSLTSMERTWSKDREFITLRFDCGYNHDQ